MPQDLSTLLMNRPATTGQSTPLPAIGPETWLDKVVRAAKTGMGLEQQQPGDLPSAIGAAAGIVGPGMLHSAFGEAGPAISQLGELDSRITGIPPVVDVPASTVTESPEDKLYRIIRDRQQNPTPRVPPTPTKQDPYATLNQNIDTGTSTNSPAIRRQAVSQVKDAYNQLAQGGLAAPPMELDKLRDQVDTLQNGSLKPAPTGQQAPQQQAAIIAKLMQSGYKPTATDLATLSDLISKAALELKTGSGSGVGTPLQTGEVVRRIATSLSPKDPLRTALKGLTGWNAAR